MVNVPASQIVHTPTRPGLTYSSFAMYGLPPQSHGKEAVHVPLLTMLPLRSWRVGDCDWPMDLFMSDRTGPDERGSSRSSITGMMPSWRMYCRSSGNRKLHPVVDLHSDVWSSFDLFDRINSEPIRWYGGISISSTLPSQLESSLSLLFFPLPPPAPAVLFFLLFT